MMIPKSVSVSTRIIAIGAVLLIPAWGWAGDTEPMFMRHHCSMSDGKGGELVYDCDNPPEVICLKRMREAMARMAVLIQKENRGSLTLEYERTQGQWAKTMKDCVEGR